MVAPDLVQQLHRMLKKQPDGLSIMDLATSLAASPDQLRSALSELTGTQGVQISYDASTRRYSYQGESAEASDGISMTSAEMRGMVTILDLLNDILPGQEDSDVTAIRQQIEQMLRHRGINATELSRRIRILSSTRRPTSTHIYEQVSDALFNRKQLHIHYVASDQSISERDISPQTLVYYRDNWYLDAWCHKRNELRTFMLSRIRSAYQTNAAADELSRDQNEAHLHNSYGIFSGDEKHLAELVFLPGAAHLVAQQQWHPKAKGQWQGDNYHLELPYNDDRELLRDLLSYAPNVIVSAPDKLKAEYTKRLQDALNRNI